MKLIFALISGLFALNAFAIGCDCYVVIYSPITASHEIPPNVFKKYELEEFSSYSVKNQKMCRSLCQERFEEDMPSERLYALMMAYSNKLIDENQVGYNCTGLTTLKYPIRVEATLGRMALGNVSDFVQVVSVEEECFF